MQTLRLLRDGLIAIWLLVKLRLLERRFGPDARSSLPSSRSSTRTGLRPSSPVSALDPERTFHDAPCLTCGFRDRVALARTRLERRPWQLVWTCASCGDEAHFPSPPDLIRPMLAMEKAGGVGISVREARAFAKASADEFEAAVRDELLP